MPPFFGPLMSSDDVESVLLYNSCVLRRTSRLTRLHGGVKLWKLLLIDRLIVVSRLERTRAWP